MVESKGHHLVHVVISGNCPRPELAAYLMNACRFRPDCVADRDEVEKPATIRQRIREGIMKCQANSKQLGYNYKENLGKIPGSQSLLELFSMEVVGKSPSF